MTQDVTLGRRIASRRTLLGLTQTQLALRLETTQATVSDWENGKQVPGFENAKRIATELETSLDYLAGRDS